MLKTLVYNVYFTSFYYLCFTNVLRNGKLVKTSEKCLLKYSHIKKRLWQQ